MREAMRELEAREEQGHSEFCEGHVDCDTCKSEQCGKVLNMRSDGRAVTVMCLGCMNVQDMAQIEVHR